VLRVLHTEWLKVELELADICVDMVCIAPNKFLVLARRGPINIIQSFVVDSKNGCSKLAHPIELASVNRIPSPARELLLSPDGEVHVRFDDLLLRVDKTRAFTQWFYRALIMFVYGGGRMGGRVCIWGWACMHVRRQGVRSSRRTNEQCGDIEQSSADCCSVHGCLPQHNRSR
jgi:hypothetical protein